MANKIQYTPFISESTKESTPIKSLITNKKSDLILPKKQIQQIEIEPYVPQFEMKEPEIPKGRIEFKSKDIQLGNTQSILDQFMNAGINLRITSGYRPGAKTKQGRDSWHGLGEALDITPIEGETFDDLKSRLKSSPNLVKWLRDNGYGIIDETTQDVLARTGGTGAHWHIGKDRLAVEGLEKLLLKNGGKIQILQKGDKLIPIKEDFTKEEKTFLKKGEQGYFPETKNNHVYFGKIPNSNKLKVDEERQWLLDWYNHPETKERAKKQNNINDWDRLNYLNQLGNYKVQNINVYPNQEGYSNNTHFYNTNVITADPSDKMIQFHELNHSYDLFHKYALPMDKAFDTLSENEQQNDSGYYSHPTEIQTRLMEIRKTLNKKPGENITRDEFDDAISKQNKARKNEYFKNKVYNLDKLYDLINIIASNKSKQEIPYAKKGMKMPKYQSGGQNLNAIFYRPYQIKKNETLSNIAQTLGVSLGSLAQINNIEDPNRIYEGQEINVPTTGYIPQWSLQQYNQPQIKTTEPGQGVLLTEEQLKEIDGNNRTGKILERVSKKGQKWDVEYINLIDETFKDSKVPLDVIYDLIDSESGFNPLAKSQFSSASGLFQVVQGTAKEILGDEAAREYKNGTRSFHNQIRDGQKIIDSHIRNIKDGDFSYGRVKVSLLGPNYKMNQIIPNNVYQNSLSKDIKKLLPKGSTFQDLVDIYNSGIKN